MDKTQTLLPGSMGGLAGSPVVLPHAAMARRRGNKSLMPPGLSVCQIRHFQCGAAKKGRKKQGTMRSDLGPRRKIAR